MAEVVCTTTLCSIGCKVSQRDLSAGGPLSIISSNFSSRVENRGEARNESLRLCERRRMKLRVLCGKVHIGSKKLTVASLGRSNSSLESLDPSLNKQPVEGLGESMMRCRIARLQKSYARGEALPLPHALFFQEILPLRP